MFNNFAHIHRSYVIVFSIFVYESCVYTVMFFNYVQYCCLVIMFIIFCVLILFSTFV